jgi:diacylglycerol kinase (ATP)
METPTTTRSTKMTPPRAEPAHGDGAQDGRMLKGKRGLQRLINATRYSRDGLLEAWRNEDAFRQEVALVVILAPLALLLPVTIVERILLIGVLLIVLIVELLNSAVEVAVDRDSFEINSLGKRAKDLGSAAVFLALVLAGGTWVAILWSNFGPVAVR